MPSSDFERHLLIRTPAERIKDQTREGFSLDTKAQIYFIEEKYDESLECSDKAIKILKSSENVAYLVEAYMTKTKKKQK